MSQFCVVLSDSPNAALREQGNFLYRFLKLFVGGEQVLLLRPEQFPLANSVQVENVLMAVPTRLSPGQLQGLLFKRLCVFDFDDGLNPCWEYTERSAWQAAAAMFLKTSRNQAERDGIKIGLLPVILPEKMSRFLGGFWYQIYFLRLGLHKRPGRFKYDVGFLGKATNLSGPNYVYDQRVEWLKEIKTMAPMKFWGGLQDLPYISRAELAGRHGPVDDLFFAQGEKAFGQYFKKMCQCKVALVPAGHARWTYRHVEAMYSMSVIVSTQLQGHETLIPVTEATLNYVPDHQPLAPVLNVISANWNRHFGQAIKNYAFIEGYLAHGSYAKGRPKIFERFCAQLPA